MRPLLLLAALLAAAGCDPQERSAEPSPAAVVAVERSGRCTFDGRPMTDAEVRLALKRLVDSDTRADRTGSRATVRLVAAPGADYKRVDDLMVYCQSLGINRIELPAGGR